jgi:flavin prenyltransferase
MTAKPSIIVAITGASGAIYGVRLLQLLRQADMFSHLVISSAGWMNLAAEVALSQTEIEGLAGEVHNPKDVGATIASGSFVTQGMIIAPCSMKTLASVAHGFSDNLITRCADVVLKERRRLVMMVRETPFNLAHLRNMVAVTEMGGIVYPPLPQFYHRPESIQALVDHTCQRVLDLFGISSPDMPRWPGLKVSLQTGA